MSTGLMQLGKNGVTDGFIETLKNRFKKYENMKIPILKGAGHERERAKEYAEKILDKLGKNYTARVIGFTIVVKKWRKPVR